MKEFQFVVLIVASVLTAAMPTANDVKSSNDLDKSITGKTIYKTPNGSVPFAKPSDCDEVRQNGNRASGVYVIWPRKPRSKKTASTSFQVYCDMTTAGGGWTVLQRRGQYGNSKNYFNKTWEFYKHGFGDLEREFWIGNEIIYALTNQWSYSVRFDMRHVNGTSAYALFEKFWIEDEDQKYKLNITGYSGNAGDSMSIIHHGMKFSTWDNDNDKWSLNCASTYAGGFWFNGCHEANLNGMNWKGKYVDSTDTGIAWDSFVGVCNSLEFSEIKIKPRHFR